mgnify:CR=1 FL=1
MKKIIFLLILLIVSNLYSQREFYELRKYELKWGTSQKILNDYHRAYGLKNIALRYFCAAGATEKAGHRPLQIAAREARRFTLGEAEALFGNHHDGVRVAAGDVLTFPAMAL